MPRERPIGLAMTGLALCCAGCLEAGSPWGRTAPSVTGAAPVASETTEPEAPLATNAESAPSGESTQVAQADQQISQFLDALAKYDAPDDVLPQGDQDRLLNTPPQQVQRRLVAPNPDPEAGAAPEASRIAGPPGVNTALDLNPTETADSPAPPATPTQQPGKPVVERVAVRPTAPVSESEDAESPAVGVNVPVEPGPTGPNPSLQAMIESLRQDVEDNPADLDTIWRLVLLEAACGEEARVRELLAGVALDTGDTLASTSEVLQAVRQALNEPGPASDRALEAIQRLRMRFVREAELQIPSVALCTRVSTFGVYDEMDAAALVPFRPNPVIVYCEVRNFHSETTANAHYRVTLASRLELLTADGRSVWTHEERDIEDRSRQRREDFFLAQRVTFPAELGPGEYVLKVMIEDTTAAKATEAAHRFVIGPTAVTQAGPPS